MLRRLSTLLLVIGSLSLFCMDKKTWYVERDKWKPGTNQIVARQNFVSFDTIAEGLKKIANKDAHLRLLIMQLISHKIKACFIKILIEEDYKKEPKDRLIASDITDNFVIIQDIKDAEIQPKIREYKEQINEFIDKILSCDLFSDYFMVLQPKLLAFFRPIMYINEDTLNDLNNYLVTVEQVALVLFSDEPARERIAKLNAQKDLIASLGLNSIVNLGIREQLRSRLTTAIVHAVRGLEAKALKERELTVRQEQERKKYEQIEQEAKSADYISSLFDLTNKLRLLSQVHPAVRASALPVLPKQESVSGSQFARVKPAAKRLPPSRSKTFTAGTK